MILAQKLDLMQTLLSATQPNKNPLPLAKRYDKILRKIKGKDDAINQIRR